MFISKKLIVRKTEKGKSLFTKSDIKKDEILIKFEGKISKYPNKSTLQIEENKHLETVGKMYNFLNHSCEPNGYINLDDLTFRAHNKINKGEKINFNYLTTEWDMANKFQCHCKSKNCFKNIKGFKYLNSNQKIKLKSLLSPFLKQKLRVID